MQRTNDAMTAGIVNIPLTKPAIIHFLVDNDKIEDIITVYNSFHIPFVVKQLGKKTSFSSQSEVDYHIMKQIWHNFRSLRPKFISNWRYLFWEIDTTDNEMFNQVLNLYADCNLPVFVHRSMRGYHFISLRPILKEKWGILIDQLRFTNLEYPPITIRIKPNKYEGESDIYKTCFIQSKVFHSDTARFYEAFKRQDIEMIERNYMVVYYMIDKIQGAIV